MAGKLEIQWSPISNKFITWGSEICLYEVQPARETSAHVFSISNAHCAQLLATNTNHRYVRSVDIYPKSETDLLLAIGLTNGRVALSTFGPSEYDARGFPGKELVPKHPRQCNAVLFNRNDSQLIATGLDKFRSDSSVLIWDINKFSNSDSNNSGRLAVNTMAPAVELVKPVAEFGMSELANSLAWFHGASRLLACGMNMKNVKIYDMRDPNKMINSTLTKAVYGISINPHEDRHLASFFDNVIYLWDLRNFEKPVQTLPHAKQLLKIEWCPTRSSVLASLQKDSSVINLYDIQHTIVGNEEVEPTVMERVVVPGSPHNITSFSWHSNDENRLLTIAVSGTIKDYTVFDRSTVNWTPTSNIIWSKGRKTLRYINDSFLNDVSTRMKEGAKTRYGLQEDFYKNAKLVNNEVLSNVWNWLHLSAKLVDEGIIRGMSCRHPGVTSIISKMDLNTTKSETVTVTWAELGNPNCQGSAKYYRHEERDKILHLCSWPLDRDVTSLTKFLEQLEREGAYTRAAAIAVFNLRVQLAIDLLSRAPDSTEYGSSLNVVAMALAGFSDDASSVWKQYCSTSKSKLMDPYLKAMFGFLTAENYNYDTVLTEAGVAVDDRVAFACMFLPDGKLLEYLKWLSEKLCDEGNLDGLLLTGNSGDGLRLLQKYLDSTGDIQSTALIALRGFHADLGTQTVKDWIENYRYLLDTWKLFYERADFDVMLAQFKPNEKPPRQVYISCSFCGKSISAYMAALNRGRGQFQRMTGTANKLSSCPNCRKPLPRCSICLMHMGTTTMGEMDVSKSVSFDNWFTWCQSCRHGGHSGHMTQWFKEHQECPVTGCNCRCFAIDAVASKSS